MSSLDFLACSAGISMVIIALGACVWLVRRRQAPNAPGSMQSIDVNDVLGIPQLRPRNFATPMWRSESSSTTTREIPARFVRARPPTARKKKEEGE